MRGMIRALVRRMKRALVWLSRIGHGNGFGVQSPTDYHFVRYVICERAPYYLYEELEHSVKDIGCSVRHLCRLYFRLSNYCQSESFIDVQPETGAYSAYVRAACSRTSVYIVDDVMATLVVSQQDRVFARITYHEGVERLAAPLLEVADGSVVVVEGIEWGSAARRWWKELLLHERAGITYDLYDCGIIIVGRQRDKKNYIINY